MTNKIKAMLLAITTAFALIFACNGLTAAAEPAKKPPLQLQSQKIELPDDDNSYPDGPGADIANSYCAICHSAAMVSAQPAFPKDKWVKIVNKMRMEFGCPVPEENVDTLADYLYKINSEKNGVKVEAATK